MAPSFACLAGPAVYRMQQAGQLLGREIGSRWTPFGPSEAVYLVEDCEAPFYLLPHTGAEGFRVTAGFVNYRANLYALKELGVRAIMSFTAAGAISHNYNVGDVVLVTDLIDRTRTRPTTFFENSALGVLRQFPVFCPALQQAISDCLAAMGASLRSHATMAVTEGPRLETPAEIRWLAATGAELVAHYFAPDAFLAKELELCFAGVAYVANYAETGSQYRPFSANDLFDGLAAPTENERVDDAVEIIGGLIGQVSRYVATHPRDCECGKTMRRQVEKFGLPDDWRQWFDASRSAPTGRYDSAKQPPKQVTRAPQAQLENPS